MEILENVEKWIEILLRSCLRIPKEKINLNWSQFINKFNSLGKQWKNVENFDCGLLWESQKIPVPKQPQYTYKVPQIWERVEREGKFAWTSQWGDKRTFIWRQT